MIDFEKAKDQKIREMGVDAYLQQFKTQIDLMPWSNEEKFEAYYEVRCETLQKYAA